MYATKAANVEILKLLINNSADVDKKNNHNNTALHIAAKLGKEI